MAHVGEDMISGLLPDSEDDCRVCFGRKRGVSVHHPGLIAFSFDSIAARDMHVHTLGYITISKQRLVFVTPSSCSNEALCFR
jgi:hypothetical protein